MDGYLGSWSFVAEYCLYVFIAVIGMLQMIAARWEIRGISFFGKKVWGYAFGIIAIAAVFIWFFRFTGLDLAHLRYAAAALLARGKHTPCGSGYPCCILHREPEANATGR